MELEKLHIKRIFKLMKVSFKMDYPMEKEKFIQQKKIINFSMKANSN
jgi:hypothetical protein